MFITIRELKQQNANIYELEKKYEEDEYKKAYIDRLWKCRDFELTHFWQRSVFLGTFLVVIYGGYGALVKIGLEKIFTMEIHGIALGIALVGSIFSIMWIMMAKGSKFWYEMYEKKIYAFEEQYTPNYMSMDDDCDEKNEIPQSIFLFGNAHAHRFSLTKLTIIMGQVSAGIFYVLMNVHTILLFKETRLDFFLRLQKQQPCAGFLVTLIISLINILVLYFISQMIQLIMANDIDNGFGKMHSKINKQKRI